MSPLEAALAFIAGGLLLAGAMVVAAILAIERYNRTGRNDG